MLLHYYMSLYKRRDKRQERRHEEKRWRKSEKEGRIDREEREVRR